MGNHGKLWETTIATCSTFASEIGNPTEILDTPKEILIIPRVFPNTPKVTLVLTTKKHLKVMALELNLTKNTNEQLEGTLGKYYARVEYKGTIGIKELAAHMHQHNTAFSKGIVMGVLGDMVDCIKHLVLDGYTVKIDDLGIFKASVDANGLTLEKGAKISAGRGVQRTDEELQANIAAQQFAVGDVKIIMQATGNTVIEKMNSDAKLSFTSKTKAMVKSLTGSDATEDSNGGGGGSNGDSSNSSTGDNGGNSGSGSNGGDNGGNTGGGGLGQN